MSAPDIFSVDILPPAGSTVTVAVSGEVDMTSGPQLRDALNQAAESSPGTLAVDLSAVTFLDSGGLHALLDAQRRLAGSGGRLLLLSPAPAARLALELCGLLEHIDVAAPAGRTAA